MSGGCLPYTAPELVRGDPFRTRQTDLFAASVIFWEALTGRPLFLGANATVVYGDKGIGTNHVLPTERAARYTGGLWVGKFLKTVTWQMVSDAGNQLVAPGMAAISKAENMKGHAITAEIRLAEKNTDF